MLRSLLIAVLAGAAASASAQDVGVISPLFENIPAVPGQTYERVLTLENLSDQTQRARITQVDYASGLDGTSFYPPTEDGTVARSNAGWITLPRTSIVVPADTTVDVPFTITIPPGPNVVGTYWSVLMVEPVSTAPRVDADLGDVQVRIANRYRYAVHVSVTVGSLRPTVAFDTPRLVDEPRMRALMVDLRNDGEALVQPDVWVDVFHADGRSAGRFDARPRPIYPASAATTPVDFTTLPGGRYTGILYVDAGADDLLGSRLAFELSDPLPPPTDAEPDPSQTP